MTRTLLRLILGSLLLSPSSAQPAERPWLGVQVEALVDATGHELLRVQQVTAMSPAALGGVMTGDLILGVGDADVVRAEGEELIPAFLRLLGDVAPGDTVSLRIRRPGHPRGDSRANGVQ